jgi:LDH2 family malate/lactate/ureidoglycolate dehydrogenase
MAENWGNEMRLVRIEDLRHCLMAAFERLELPREDAEQVAEVLLDSELRGHESHGVHLLGFLADAYRGGMNPRPRIQMLQETEGRCSSTGTAATWSGRCGRCAGASSAPASARAWR